MHEFPINNSSQQPHLTSISSEVNRSYQLGSQGMVGLTTQSSLYGLNQQQQQTINHSMIVGLQPGDHKKPDSLFRNNSKSPN